MKLFSPYQHSIISIYHIVIMGCSLWTIIFLMKMIHVYNQIQIEYANNPTAILWDGRVMAHVKPEVVIGLKVLIGILLLIILLVAVTWQPALRGSTKAKYVLYFLMITSFCFAGCICFGIKTIERNYFWKSGYTRMYLLTLVPFLISSFLLPFALRKRQKANEKHENLNVEMAY